jgi:hypothetical protein
LKDVTGVHFRTALQELVRVASINIRNSCTNTDGNVYDMKEDNEKPSMYIAAGFEI